MDKEKTEKYQLLTEQIRALIEGETDVTAVMANVCAAIHEAMGFWWTGFYRVTNGELMEQRGQSQTRLDSAESRQKSTEGQLVLGPFQGPVACMHIGYGKGVCGTAWKEQKTIIVPDVEQFPGHIACSSLSCSEIVVPIFDKTDEIVAVLDIDSKELSTFDDTDRRYLEEICSLIAPLFVKQYTYKYPRPSVTADCVVITKEAEPKVLLIQRGGEPFKGNWAFPGGFMEMNETTEQCAIRELEEETGLKVDDIRQIGAYSKVLRRAKRQSRADRDPRGRTTTVAYLAIVNSPMEVAGQDDAANAQWFPLSSLPQLAFDHAEIMEDAVRKYKEIVR